ncbi:MAG: hypothetical protein ACOXZW_02055 [Bacilli bacterium]|jgi:hypothetical protein|nr:hypothetical protein [Bacilli bacterium]
MFDSKVLNDNLKYLKFDSDFNINLEEDSTVYFGYNGIGKTSIYNYIVNSDFSNRIDYFDVDRMKEDFIKIKGSIVIAAKVAEIENLQNHLKIIQQDLSIDSQFKQAGINATVAKQIDILFEEIQSSKQIDSFTLSKERLNEINQNIPSDYINCTVKNYKRIKGVSNVEEEINNLKSVYLKNAR